jgi:uncharacterized protein YjdB
VIVGGIRAGLVAGLDGALNRPLHTDFVSGISVTPLVATVAAAGIRQLAAAALLSTGGSEVVTADLAWTSSNEAVATVDGGRITGESAGVAVITGTSEAGRFGSMTITVT